MEILPSAQRTGVQAQLVLLMTLLMGQADTSQNYFEVNGVFSSTELTKDLAVAEEEIIRQLETLYHLTAQTAHEIRQHIDEWRLTTGRASRGDEELLSQLSSFSHRVPPETSQLSSSSHRVPPETIQKPSGISETSNNYTLRVEHQLRKTANGSKTRIAYHPVDALLLLRRTALSFKKLSKSLTTFSIAVNGLESIGRLTVHDAVLLGRVADNNKMKKLADEWFIEAAAMLDRGAECPPNVTPYIPRSRDAQKKVISIVSKEALDYQREEALDHQREAPKLQHPLSGLEETAAHLNLHCSFKLLPNAEKSSLSCRLERLQSPYLLLMPLKLEELSLSPRVVLYRDFLSRGQIDCFIAKAQPELMPSEVDDGDAMDKRDSQTAWLGKDEYDEDDPFDPHPELDEDDFLTNMNRKIEAATGLRVAFNKASESYQVVHYSDGGYFVRHSDYFDKPGPNGHRQATFLMYLTDVPAGGWTVFPQLKVGVQPVRGTALFWHNLDSRGKPNPEMIHAGCPVLSGDKWIATKWILSNEQFRSHPCPLENTRM